MTLIPSSKQRSLSRYIRQELPGHPNTAHARQRLCRDRNDASDRYYDLCYGLALGNDDIIVRHGARARPLRARHLPPIADVEEAKTNLLARLHGLATDFDEPIARVYTPPTAPRCAPPRAPRSIFRRLLTVLNRKP